MKSIKRNQFGETIVEVLIGIAILSGALGMAFAISNRSTKTTQANQERYQAQIFANEQADRLKIAMADPARKAQIDGFTTNSFCLNGNVPTLNGPLTCKFGLNNLYDIRVIQRVDPGIETQTFLIRVEWNSLVNGGGRDSIEVGYGT